MGYDVVEYGGLAGAAFNAAKEEALDNFISCKLSFRYGRCCRATMDELVSKNELDSEVELDSIIALDSLARSVAKTYIGKL